MSSDGFDTNKIEGQWRQLKVNLPTHRRKKEHYSSYLAEFIWRYVHRGEDLFKEFLKDGASVYKLEWPKYSELCRVYLSYIFTL